MENTSTTVGIDVSKAMLDVHILATSEDMQFANAARDIRLLAKVLKTHDVSLVVMEATGGYEQKAAVLLTTAGLPVAIVHPERVHKFIQSQGPKAKTDKLDARHLARYADVMHPRITAMPNAAQRSLRALVSRRTQLAETISQEKNRRGRASKETLGSIKDHLAYLKNEVSRLDVEILLTLRNDARWNALLDLLCSATGVGVVVAATIIAYLPEIGTVNRRQIAALVGVCPYNQESGNQHHRGKIAEGRKAVRSILYMAALSAVQHSPRIMGFYERLVAAGKAPKLAIVACMRKLIVILNAMVRSGTHWDPTKGVGEI